MKTKEQIEKEAGKFYVEHLVYHVEKLNMFPTLTNRKKK